MATLKELKPQIDQGKRVVLKLHGDEIKILIGLTLEGYTWLLERNFAYPKQHLSGTNFHQHGKNWDTFLKYIEGVQTETDQWKLMEESKNGH